MVDLVTGLEELEAALLEEKRLLKERLALLRRTLAEAKRLSSSTDVVFSSTENRSRGNAGDEEPVGGGDAHVAGFGVPRDGVDGFLDSEQDPDTGEPIYDSRVVAGKRTMRRRAHAAARVYGPRLRVMSLAVSIFETGETEASGPASVRSSLGGLVRYGDDWTRERGWLHCVPLVTPDVEMIRRLSDERVEVAEVAAVVY